MAKNTGLGKGLNALFTDKLVMEEMTEEEKKGQKILLFQRAAMLENRTKS